MSSEGTVVYSDVGPYIVRTAKKDVGVDGPIEEARQKGEELGRPWGISKPGQGYVLAHSDE